MTDPSIRRPGRLRVISMLPNGVLDPHVTHSFPAFIAPDGKSAEAYLKTQPMGSYLFVHNMAQPRSWWRPTDFSLSVMVKYRTRTQVAHLPIRFKTSTKWFSSMRRSAYIEWSKNAQPHKAYVDPTIYPTLRAFWAEYLLYVGEKVSEICQDPHLNEHWTPSTTIPASVRVLGHPVADGIHVDIMQERPISIRFNFQRCSIDVHLNRRKISLDGSLWRIKYPWNITFAGIKDVALGNTSSSLRPKSFDLMAMPRGSTLKYIPSCRETEDEHVEEELLQALIDRAQLYQNAAKESSLTDVLQILLRLQPDQSTTPKLLELRLDILGFLVQLQAVDLRAAKGCSRPTADRAIEYIVHLARQYDAGSIGAEKIAQVVRGAIQVNPDVAYLLGLLNSLITIPSFQEAFVKNQGLAALWSRWAELMAEVHPVVSTTTECLLEDFVSPKEAPAQDEEVAAPLNSIPNTPPKHRAAHEAGTKFALQGISFVRDEFARRFPHTRQPSTELCEAGDGISSPDKPNLQRVSTSVLRPPLSAPCKACMCPRTQQALQFLRAIDKCHEKTGATMADKVNPACMQLLASELVFWERQPVDSCWRRLFLSQWLRKFESWAWQDDAHTALDVPWVASIVGRVHAVSVDGLVQVRIFCQLLASLPAQLDEKQSSGDEGKAAVATIAEIVASIADTCKPPMTLSLAHAILELWRLLLLSTGWHATKLKLLHLFVNYPSLYTVANVAREAFDAAVAHPSAFHVDYTRWLVVSLGFLGSHGTNIEGHLLYPRAFGAVWSKLLYKMGCPVPAGGFENMHLTTVERFLQLAPPLAALLDKTDRGLDLRCWKSYLGCLAFAPPPAFPPSTQLGQFSRFLAVYYHHRDLTSQRLLWECIGAVSKWVGTALIDTFVLSQLFSVKPSECRPQPTELSAIHSASHIIPHLGVIEMASIPLLQLHKVSSQPHLHPRTPNAAAPADTHPLEDLQFWCSSEMYVEFVLHLFDMLISTTDNQSLHPNYCGRFGGSSSGRFDVLYWLQLQLECPQCKDVVPELAHRMTDATSRRLQAKLRLLKLAASTLSDRVVFFRGFDPPRQGAFGTIYRCTSDMPVFRLHSHNMRESIALKVVAPQKFPNERSILYSVYNEVAIMDHLRGNEAAIQLYDYGLSKEGFFIAMEYADDSLKGWRDAHASTLSLETLLAVCGALSKIHSASVAHLDIKCENVLVRTPSLNAFDVCIGDFGESFLAPDTSIAFDCLYARGTEAIQSPEMLNFTGTITSAADVWSVGCLLFELITGSMLFASEEWPTLFAHLTKSQAPVLMEKHRAMLHVAVSALNATKDDAVIKNQVALAADLLEFILVRDPLRRPSLDSIQQRLHDFQLTGAPSPPPSRPQPTAIDAMARQVRLLDAHHALSTGKIRLSPHLYLGWQAEWNGEHGIIVTHTPATGASSSSLGRTIVIAPRHSLPFDDQEEAYANDLLRQGWSICAMIWDLYVSNRVVLLDVPSKPVMRALVPVLYVYHMLFFGPSCFELVKQLWKPHEAMLVPSTALLTAVLCWEEKRCIAHRLSSHAAVYQCICGSHAFQASQPDIDKCCAASSPCALCVLCQPHLQHVGAITATTSFKWVDTNGRDDLVNLAHWGHWGEVESPVDEVAASDDTWQVFRCAVCRMITRAVRKDGASKHLAMIRTGRGWSDAQRRLYFSETEQKRIIY